MKHFLKAKSGARWIVSEKNGMDIGQQGIAVAEIGVSEEIRIDRGRVYGVYTRHNEKWLTSAGIPVQPLRRHQCLILRRFVQRDTPGDIFKAQCELAESVRVNIGRGEDQVV